MRRLSELLDAVLADLPEYRGAPIGIQATGLFDLDVVLSGGLPNGSLCFIGSHSGNGKTSFLLSVARFAAIGRNSTVAFFSGEASLDRLFIRILSAESGVELYRLESGTLTEDEIRRVVRCLPLIDGPLFCDDSVGLTILEIRTRCAALQAKRGLDLVLIDNVRMLRAPDGTAFEDLEASARALKVFARDLNIPVAVTGQTDRLYPSSGLGSLGASRSFENYADTIVLIEGDWPQDTQSAWTDVGLSERRPVVLNVAKHRHGAVGRLSVHWTPTTLSFQNIALRPEPGGA